MQKELKQLETYEFISITRKSPYFSASFGQPYQLIDEGSFYRLADLHIVEKNNVADLKVEDNVVKITYMDGRVLELEIMR